MKPRADYEARFYVALKRITAYMTTDQLRRQSEKKYGLGYEEALEMAYENVIGEAMSALQGYRKKRSGPARNGAAVDRESEASTDRLRAPHSSPHLTDTTAVGRSPQPTQEVDNRPRQLRNLARLGLDADTLANHLDDLADQIEGAGRSPHLRGAPEAPAASEDAREATPNGPRTAQERETIPGKG